MAGSLEVDIAVLEVNLGGEMSHSVADVLQQHGIPFVFATGYRTDDLPESLRNAAALTKPFEADQLGTALSLVRRNSGRRRRPDPSHGGRGL